VIRASATGIIVSVRVIPRARRTAIAGVRDDAILVRVAAPPVDDAANQAVIDLFAAALHCPRAAVRILSGERSRHKEIAIDGVGPDAVRNLLMPGS
jgi:uncharacterized protein